jgi:hypothetical protein
MLPTAEGIARHEPGIRSPTDLARRDRLPGALDERFALQDPLCNSIDGQVACHQ